MSNFCPACSKPIAIDDLNMKEGVGLCRGCNRLWQISELVDLAASQSDVADPPKGCRLESLGSDFVATASLRSIGTAIPALLVCLFWNGITSIFVFIALSNLYIHIVGPLPSSLPSAPFNQGAAPVGTTPASAASASQVLPLPVAIFLVLFMLPFIAIGLFLLASVFLSFVGRVEVGVQGAVGFVRTAVGRIGWTRRFDPARVKSVRIDRTSYRVNNQHRPLILLEADRTIKFGSHLRDERRQWLRSVLVLLLTPAASG